MVASVRVEDGAEDLSDTTTAQVLSIFPTHFGRRTNSRAPSEFRILLSMHGVPRTASGRRGRPARHGKTSGAPGPLGPTRDPRDAEWHSEERWRSALLGEVARARWHQSGKSSGVPSNK